VATYTKQREVKDEVGSQAGLRQRMESRREERQAVKPAMTAQFQNGKTVMYTFQSWNIRDIRNRFLPKY
jgi:hypothetical protein